MNSPFKAHCPKCGRNDAWKSFITGDKLVCTHIIDDIQCGYVHRLQPSHEEKYAQATIQQALQRTEELDAKKERVRVLVHLMAGRNDIFFHQDIEQAKVISKEIVRLAVYMDDEIESLK